MQGRGRGICHRRLAVGVWTSNIAGTPAFTKQVLIDGTLQQGSESGGVSEDYPPMDAVQEFKVDSGARWGSNQPIARVASLCSS